MKPRRRSRSDHLPFEELDLRSVGVAAIEMHLPFRLHPDAAKALRKMGEKRTSGAISLAASRSYRTRTKQQSGVDLEVEIERTDMASLKIEYRPQIPPKRKVNFDRVWGRVVHPATSDSIRAFVIATAELTSGRIARLPVRLPLDVPGLPEAFGRIEGLTLAKKLDDQKVYEAWLNLVGETYTLTLLFHRDVTQVATAPADLLRATSELLNVLAPEDQPSADA